MKTHLRTPLLALAVAGAMAAVTAPAMAQGRFDLNIGVGPRYEVLRPTAPRGSRVIGNGATVIVNGSPVTTLYRCGTTSAIGYRAIGSVSVMTGTTSRVITSVSA